MLLRRRKKECVMIEACVVFSQQTHLWPVDTQVTRPEAEHSLNAR